MWNYHAERLAFSRLAPLEGATAVGLLLVASGAATMWCARARSPERPTVPAVLTAKRPSAAGVSSMAPALPEREPEGAAQAPGMLERKTGDEHIPTREPLVRELPGSVVVPRPVAPTEGGASPRRPSEANIREPATPSAEHAKPVESEQRSLMRATRWVPILATVFVLGSSSARAEPPPAEAKDLFTRGRDLRARGDCAGAIAIFHKASEVYPAGLGSLRNIAECQEISGQYVSARRTWVDLKARLGSSPSPRYEGWSQDADQALARLATRVATVIVDLTVVGSRGEPATTGGIGVTINDEALAPNLVGAPVKRDPGRTVVRALGPDGHVLDEQLVDLAPGETAHVALRQGSPPAWMQELRSAPSHRANGLSSAAPAPALQLGCRSGLVPRA